MTLGSLIKRLYKLGGLDVIDANLDMNDTSEHKVNQKAWKEVTILPYAGIENNTTFLFNKGEKFIVFGDGTKAKVLSAEEKPIFDLEAEIQQIYGTDAYSFAKKWYKFMKNMYSFYFIVIKSQKE